LIEALSEQQYLDAVQQEVFVPPAGVQ